MESKHQLYNQMMSTLQELKSDFVTEASLAIQKRVLLMEEFRNALRLGIYSPSGNEVRTDQIFTEGDRNRKEFYFPVKDEAEGRLVFYRVANLEQLYPKSGKPPRAGGATSRLRDESMLETLLVTGVAFDLRGGRLGFGGGFFDNCLQEFSGKRIALAYDFQVVPELPTSERKQKVDLIVTESRVIRCL